MIAIADWKWLCVALLVGLLCTLFFIRLRSLAYTQVEAAGLAVSALAQPAYVSSGALRSAAVVLATFAVATAAAAFVNRQDPRRTVVLGSSLAGAQLANPILGTLTMIALPLAIRRSLPDSDAARFTGIYVSLLFIPVLMTLTLLGLALVGKVYLPAWHPIAGSPRQSVVRFLFVAIATGPLFLATRLRNFSPVKSVAVAVCCIFLASTLLAELLSVGSMQLSLQTGAAIPALSVLVVSGWPTDRGRIGPAIATILASVVLSWAFMGMVAVYA